MPKLIKHLPNEYQRSVHDRGYIEANREDEDEGKKLRIDSEAMRSEINIVSARKLFRVHGSTSKMYYTAIDMHWGYLVTITVIIGGNVSLTEYESSGIPSKYLPDEMVHATAIGLGFGGDYKIWMRIHPGPDDKIYILNEGTNPQMISVQYMTGVSL